MDFTFIPDQCIHRTCHKFPLAWLCNAPLSHKRSCVSDLFYNMSATCSTTQLIQDETHLVHCEHPLFLLPCQHPNPGHLPKFRNKPNVGPGTYSNRRETSLPTLICNTSYTFNSEKPELTIDKATHAVIPKSVFNFTIPNYTKPPANNFLAQYPKIKIQFQQVPPRIYF